MEAVLFDLDNTLYAPERELFALIDGRINRYMSEVVGIPGAQVDGLRRSYWQRYGVTLQGLMRHYGVDPEDYLEYVHDVDVASRLQSDQSLRCALEGVEAPMVIFTNGSRDHAERVLGALGIRDLFQEIYDIRVAAYQPKPFTEPYRAVLECLGADPRACTMIEDSIPNLETAKQLGMRTVLVGPEHCAPYIDVRVASAAHVPAQLVRWQS